MSKKKRSISICQFPKTFDMQLAIIELINDVDYSNKRVMIGLSGGINSAAAAIYLAKYTDNKPKDLYLYYSHLDEHSKGTRRFVLELVKWLKNHFDNVIFETSDNSMLEYCEESFKGIPHPKISPCTKFLKLIHMTEFMAKHKIDVDIIGYVRHEYKRINRQIDRGVENKDYLIRHLSDEDCFDLVEREFGWYPSIYKIKWDDRRIGEALVKWGHELSKKQRETIQKYHSLGYNTYRKSYRVFKHNNCLPCKNMHQWELFLVRIFFPEEYKNAMNTAKKLDSHWGRADEILNENSDCAICAV